MRARLVKAATERRQGWDRRTRETRRRLGNRDAHFWVGTILGTNLLALGAGVLWAHFDRSVELIWQQPQLAPLDRMTEWPFGLFFAVVGAMVWADNLRKIRPRWARYWLVWTPAVLAVSWVGFFALLAFLLQEERPLGTLSAYVGGWAGLVLFHWQGPEIRSRER